MSLEPTHRHIPTTILLFTSPMDANKIKHSKVMMTNRPTGNVGPFYPSQMVVRRFAEFFCPLDGKTLHGTHLYSRKQKWEKIKAEKTLDKYGSWSHGHALRGHRFASPMQPIHWGCNQYFKDGKKKKKKISPLDSLSKKPSIWRHLFFSHLLVQQVTSAFICYMCQHVCIGMDANFQQLQCWPMCLLVTLCTWLVYLPLP